MALVLAQRYRGNEIRVNFVPWPRSLSGRVPVLRVGDLNLNPGLGKNFFSLKLAVFTIC